MCKLRIAGVVNDSIVDGPGFRYTIFTQGCQHNCKGCHNIHTHDIKGGYVTDIESLLNEIKENYLLSGVTFSGGEPVLQAKALAVLAERIKNETQLNIVLYSGYTYEQLKEMNDKDVDKLLSLCDWLIDGRYEEDKRNLELEYRGSENQRIIELPNCNIKRN